MGSRVVVMASNGARPWGHRRMASGRLAVARPLAPTRVRVKSLIARRRLRPATTGPTERMAARGSLGRASSWLVATCGGVRGRGGWRQMRRQSRTRGRVSRFTRLPSLRGRYCRESLASSWAWVPAPLSELQAPQSSWRLSGWSVPPLDCGTIWSTVRFLNGK